MLVGGFNQPIWKIMKSSCSLPGKRLSMNAQQYWSVHRRWCTGPWPWEVSGKALVVKLGSSSPNRDEHKKYLSCHHPVYQHINCDITTKTATTRRRTTTTPTTIRTRTTANATHLSVARFNFCTSGRWRQACAERGGLEPTESRGAALHRKMACPTYLRPFANLFARIFYFGWS